MVCDAQIIVLLILGLMVSFVVSRKGLSQLQKFYNDLINQFEFDYLSIFQFQYIKFIHFLLILISMSAQDYKGRNFKDFTFIKKIGEGSWGTVYEGFDNTTKQIVAIKVIPIEVMEISIQMKGLIETEIAVLKECKNENVISFRIAYKTERNILIITEYCNGGDLEEYILKKERIPEEEAKIFLKQILNGFKGLHEIGVMHRDFKPENILLHKQVCKICDFGFAAKCKNDELQKTVLGTSLTMAPEVLGEQSYGFEADIWSIGVVFYRMLYGKYPYFANNDFDILKKIRNSRPDYSSVLISSAARDFIDRCLTADPAKRISWKQIYEHSFLREEDEVIYHSMRSIVDVKENKNFYSHVQLTERFITEEEECSYGDGEFEDQSPRKMHKISKMVMSEEEKEATFLKYEKMYLNSLNKILFVNRYIVPYIKHFDRLKTKHSIPLFLMMKKSYNELKDLSHKLTRKENPFGQKIKSDHFEEFTNSKVYKQLISQFESDLKIIRDKTQRYMEGIMICPEQISKEFQLDFTYSRKFPKLVKKIVKQYWVELFDGLGSMAGQSKQYLLRVLIAIQYYHECKQISCSEFTKEIEQVNFRKVEQKMWEDYKKITQ